MEFAPAVDYRGKYRRFLDYGKRVYKVINQTGFSKAIPGNPADEIVELRLEGAPSSVAPVRLTMTVKVMVDISEPFEQPKVGGPLSGTKKEKPANG